MEGRNCKSNSTKIPQEDEENKYYHCKQAKKRLYFNSVTGEEIGTEDGDEEDMYEVVPDMEEYAKDIITQFTDISEQDKEFFKLWNDFVKSKEIGYEPFEGILVEFLNTNYKYIYENDLRKNFVLHLVAIYDNRQIDEGNLINIIDIMDNLFTKCEKENNETANNNK